jgi:hypothetical protein
MGWIKFTAIVIGAYVVYYFLNIVFDLIKKSAADKKVSQSQAVSYEVIPTKDVIQAEQTPHVNGTEHSELKKKSNPINEEVMEADVTRCVKEDLGLLHDGTTPQEEGLEINEENLLAVFNRQQSSTLLH